VLPFPQPSHVPHPSSLLSGSSNYLGQVNALELRLLLPNKSAVYSWLWPLAPHLLRIHFNLKWSADVCLISSLSITQRAARSLSISSTSCGGIRNAPNRDTPQIFTRHVSLWLRGLPSHLPLRRICCIRFLAMCYGVPINIAIFRLTRLLPIRPTDAGFGRDFTPKYDRLP
jgi:hypothetical protein